MTATPSQSPGVPAEGTPVGGDGLVRDLSADIAAVTEARAYTVEHFGFSKTSFVGRMPSNDYDRAVDHVVAFAGWAHETLRRIVDEVDPLHHPGLTEDIAYALGLIKRWTCQDCGCVNAHHEAFCYRCGAGPDEDDGYAAPDNCVTCGRETFTYEPDDSNPMCGACQIERELS